MKRLYTLLLLGFVGLQTQAQTTIGASFAMPRWRPLNSIIDRYNNARPWLDKEMGNVHFMPGYTASFGRMGEKFAFQALGFRKSSVRLTAKGNDDKRVMNVKLWTLSITDFTYYPLRFGKMKVGVGTSPVEMSRLKISGRINDEDRLTYYKSKALFDLFLINASSTFHVDFVYKFNPERKMFVQARLYAMVSWFNDERLVFVNDALNGLAYSSNHYATQNSGCNHIGLQIMLGLF